MQMTDTLYDVAIVGSGLGGSTLATILARAGLRVLLLEAGSHPRFAVGESVVPEFSMRAKLLAATFDVPELAWIGDFQLLRHHVSVNSGIKRNFSFLHHAEGQEFVSDHSSQFLTMTYPLGPDSHIYRPDVDAWLTALAVRYGVDYHERTQVAGFDFEHDDEVRIETAAGPRLRAKFVVDGSGYRSLLAERADEPGCKTDSRSIFTHMTGVSEFRKAFKGRLPIPSPPDQGTLHHYFDGGWFWVIPFGNHTSAVNPVTSVGLTLSRQRFPDNDLPAEVEFNQFVQRFPTIARQLSGGRAIRSWVKTGRLQYRAKRLAGERWCLLPHAVGFLDPLYSGGLALTLSGVHDIAKLLLETLPDGRVSVDSFQALEHKTARNLSSLDEIIHASYIAFRSPELFNAWFRVWAVGNYHATMGLAKLFLEYKSSADRAVLARLEEPDYSQILAGGNARVAALSAAGCAIMARVEDGAIDSGQAVDALFELFDEQDWVPPQFGLADRGRRSLASFTAFPLMSIIWWGRRHAPADVRGTFYDIGPIYFRELTAALWREACRSSALLYRTVRDSHRSRGRS
jgi:FADH2 O2-dependent halogenase